jgi:hypothetical protein
MKNGKKVHEQIAKFEDHYGSIALVKTAVQMIYRLLMDKNIVDANELRKRMSVELHSTEQMLRKASKTKKFSVKKSRPLPPVKVLKKVVVSEG